MRSRGVINVQANTIIVLVVSLVLLGLLIALLVGFFRETDRSLEDTARTVPEPPLPTRDRAVTVSAPVLHPGASFVLRIRSLPPQGVSEATAFLYCDAVPGDHTTNRITDGTATFHAAPDNQTLSFLYTGSLVPTTPSGTLLCQALVAGLDTNGAPVSRQADVTLTVGLP